MVQIGTSSKGLSMSYKPEPKVFELELFPSSFTYFTEWYNALKLTWDPSLQNSSALPHVRVKNTAGAVPYGNYWALRELGVYKVTFECSQQYDVTKTNAASTLISTAIVSQYSGATWSISSDRHKVEAYDTGRNVSTGYNVFYFKMESYIEIDAVGSIASGNPGVVPVYNSGNVNTDLGWYHANWSQYVRRFRAEKIEDVTI